MLGLKSLNFGLAPNARASRSTKSCSLQSPSTSIRLDPVVYLPTGDTDAFALVFEWLYREKLLVFPDMGSISAEGVTQPHMMQHTKIVTTLMKVYSMALLW